MKILLPVWAFITLLLFAVFGAVAVGAVIYTVLTEKHKD